MEIEVTGVDAAGVVRFRCAAGEGAGVWRSDELAPQVGLGYQVELDVLDGRVLEGRGQGDRGQDGRGQDSRTQDSRTQDSRGQDGRVFEGPVRNGRGQDDHGQDGHGGIRVDGSAVVLGGVLRVEEDGATYLQVAGSLVSVELAEGSEVADGQRVEVVAERVAVELFPFLA